MLLDVAILTGLALFAALVYLNSLSGEFIFDDGEVLKSTQDQ